MKILRFATAAVLSCVAVACSGGTESKPSNSTAGTGGTATAGGTNGAGGSTVAGGSAGTSTAGGSGGTTATTGGTGGTTGGTGGTTGGTTAGGTGGTSGSGGSGPACVTTDPSQECIDYCACEEEWCSDKEIPDGKCCYDFCESFTEAQYGCRMNMCNLVEPQPDDNYCTHSLGIGQCIDG